MCVCVVAWYGGTGTRLTVSKSIELLFLFQRIMIRVEGGAQASAQYAHTLIIIIITFICFQPFDLFNLLISTQPQRQSINAPQRRRTCNINAPLDWKFSSVSRDQTFPLILFQMLIPIFKIWPNRGMSFDLAFVENDWTMRVVIYEERVLDDIENIYRWCV